MIKLQINDGGRSQYFKGNAGDCVTRAIAIAMERDYKEVYDDLFVASKHFADTHRCRTARTIKRQGASPRDGQHKKVYRPYLADLGWTFTPTMGVGTGCQVHLSEDELPKGRIICRVSGHLCAVIDGVLHDTYDCSRDSTRCVYGYYSQD